MNVLRQGERYTGDDKLTLKTQEAKDILTELHLLAKQELGVSAKVDVSMVYTDILYSLEENEAVLTNLDISYNVTR